MPPTDSDFENVCRICLNYRSEASLFNIFQRRIVNSQLEVEDDNLLLYEAMQKITSVKFVPDDGLPQSICETCVARVFDAFVLKRLIENSHSKLSIMRQEEHVEIQDEVIIVKSSSGDGVYNISVPNTNDSDTVMTLRTLQDEDDDDITEFNVEFCNNTSVNTDDQTNIKCQTTCTSDDVVEVKNEDAVSFLLGRSVAEKKPSYKKRYQCNVCVKSFLRKSNLIDHLRLHANLRKFECTKCDKKFVQKGNLLSHMRTHSKERPFECHLCDKRYNQSSALGMHMRKHNNERNFVCHTCSKAFSSVSDLRKHERIHDPGARFKCELCSKECAQKGNLRQHMRRVHKIKHDDNIIGFEYDE